MYFFSIWPLEPSLNVKKYTSASCEFKRQFFLIAVLILKRQFFLIAVLILKRQFFLIAVLERQFTGGQEYHSARVLRSICIESLYRTHNNVQCNKLMSC